MNKLTKQNDLVIVSDYGHGLISKKAANLICKNSKFLALNAQVNASNDGFHSLEKYKKVDTLIVIANWGKEYEHTPRKKEIELAKELSNNGADIIIGDQAHWVQNHDIYNDTYISYGLGNYIFDQHWSQNTTEGIIKQYLFLLYQANSTDV